MQIAELTRLYSRLPELDDRSRREIQMFADRLLAKMLHPPLESSQTNLATEPRTACSKLCSDSSAWKTQTTEPESTEPVSF